MKKVLPQELIDLTNVMDPNSTPLKMLDPETACVLEISVHANAADSRSRRDTCTW